MLVLVHVGEHLKLQYIHYSKAHEKVKNVIFVIKNVFLNFTVLRWYTAPLSPECTYVHCPSPFQRVGPSLQRWGFATGVGVITHH